MYIKVKGENIMINDRIYLNGVTPIDVSSMSVQKYGGHDRPPNGYERQEKNKKRRYTIIQEEVIKNENKEKIIRKERSLQEHMQFMIWIGQKNKTILKD